MPQPRDEIHLTATEASAGSKPHIVRYVLLISLVLAILALSAIWITGAATNAPGSDTAHTAAPQPAASTAP